MEGLGGGGHVVGLFQFCPATSGRENGKFSDASPCWTVSKHLTRMQQIFPPKRNPHVLKWLVDWKSCSNAEGALVDRPGTRTEQVLALQI